MNRLLMATLLLTCVAGCGHRGYGAAGYADYGEKGITLSHAPASPQVRAAPERESRRMLAEESAYDFDSEEVDGELLAPDGAGAPHRPEVEADTGFMRDADESAPLAGVETGRKRLVVYNGYLELRVKRLLDAIEEIERIAAAKGGYIESHTREVVVVRVPASDFDAVMADFARVGEVLSHRVEAIDVSERFTDIASRLAVAREARERLLRLLERVLDVDERLLIMREVGRLSEMIESWESALTALGDMVDHFTITIELVPLVAAGVADTRRSPFAWVDALRAQQATIGGGGRRFGLTPPAGFVVFDREDGYRARAADTAAIRGGVVENEPLGDNAFWSDAVDHELLGRGERRVDEGTAGALRYRVYRDHELQPRYYLVALATRGKDVFAIEVFYPDEESYGRHHQAVVEALSTFEVRR